MQLVHLLVNTPRLRLLLLLLLSRDKGDGDGVSAPNSGAEYHCRREYRVAAREGEEGSGG